MPTYRIPADFRSHTINNAPALRELANDPTYYGAQYSHTSAYAILRDRGTCPTCGDACTAQDRCATCGHPADTEAR